jgi:hypothetical protein
MAERDGECEREKSMRGVQVGVFFSFFQKKGREDGNEKEKKREMKKKRKD